jgi:hypothetical protein
MALTTITLIRSDTYDFNITFKDSAGDPIDITGYEVWFTVRTGLPKTTVTDDTDATISKSYTNGGATGIITVSLSSEDTDINAKTYKYDVQYKKPDTTLKSSGAYDFIVAADITRDS